MGLNFIFTRKNVTLSNKRFVASITNQYLMFPLNIFINNFVRLRILYITKQEYIIIMYVQFNTYASQSHIRRVNIRIPLQQNIYSQFWIFKNLWFVYVYKVCGQFMLRNALNRTIAYGEKLSNLVQRNSDSNFSHLSQEDQVFVIQK